MIFIDFATWLLLLCIGSLPFCLFGSALSPVLSASLLLCCSTSSSSYSSLFAFCIILVHSLFALSFSCCFAYTLFSSEFASVCVCAICFVFCAFSLCSLFHACFFILRFPCSCLVLLSFFLLTFRSLIHPLPASASFSLPALRTGPVSDRACEYLILAWTQRPIN